MAWVGGGGSGLGAAIGCILLVGAAPFAIAVTGAAVAESREKTDTLARRFFQIAQTLPLASAFIYPAAQQLNVPALSTYAIFIIMPLILGKLKDIATSHGYTKLTTTLNVLSHLFLLIPKTTNTFLILKGISIATHLNLFSFISIYALCLIVYVAAQTISLLHL